MDEDEVTGGSREELQRALYSVDEERTICGLYNILLLIRFKKVCTKILATVTVDPHVDHSYTRV